jgi:hypothetical protein
MEIAVSNLGCGSLRRDLAGLNQRKFVPVSCNAVPRNGTNSTLLFNQPRNMVRKSQYSFPIPAGRGNR